jgi:NADH-quinone oxidoreductase subunit L
VTLSARHLAVRRHRRLTQNDIKRVIAYSTCSQLGYMFFAAGVGAYGAAMFHLFTHAFFKALLFLGAGS